MLTRKIRWLAIIIFGAILWPGTGSAPAQTPTPEFYNNLVKKVAFVDADLTALGQGQAIVKLVPSSDKREVAVAGLVSLQVPAELFLQSFREGLLGKSNPAILETGKFGAIPTVDDFAALSFEVRDLDDLKDCVVGNCKLKLSAMMIERLRKEIDWDSQDYRFQATQLLKQLLVDYVRDYLTRGDVALIEYNDKPNQVRLADEQRALMAASSSVCDAFAEFAKSSSLGSKLQLVESNVVWSKIKFGLKPVLAINHISIYKREQKAGSQILIVSKQIYANHYFDSSLSLTVFGNHPNATSAGYLFYQNRSRADGLQGPFSSIKRGIVENRAVDSLLAILEQSKADLHARGLNQVETPVPGPERSWKRWTVRGVYLLSLLAVTLFMAFLAVRNNPWRRSLKTAQRHP
jgi:hypothetical protein